MSKIVLMIFMLSIVGCASTNVGGGSKWKNGVETDKFNLCMGSCLSKTADGKQCTAFAADMAQTCKEYLQN
jgi:hypothetical protein